MLWYDSILLTICSHQYIYLSFHSKLCGILDRLVMLITPPSLTFFQPSVTFYIENSYLFCRANQVTGFYINCNTGLKWVKARDSEVAHRILGNSLENNRGGFHFSRILRFIKSAFNHSHVFSRNFAKFLEHFMSNTSCQLLLVTSLRFCKTFLWSTWSVFIISLKKLQKN